ncbi:hypothetical protein COBT_000812 [Conglomerata obtusa]
MLRIKFGSKKIVSLEVTKDGSFEDKKAAKVDIFCELSTKKMNPDSTNGPRNSKQELPIAQNPKINTTQNYSLTRNKLKHAIHHLKKAPGSYEICKMTDTPVLDSSNSILMSQIDKNLDKKRSLNQQYLQNGLNDINVASNQETYTSSADLSNKNGKDDKGINKLDAMLANLRV